MAGRSTVIPNYVTASTPRGLRRVMLRNNVRDGMQYAYEIIFNSKENKWYAWFYKDIVKDITTRQSEGLDGGN